MLVPQLAALADQGGLWLQSAAWGGSRLQAPDCVGEASGPWLSEPALSAPRCGTRLCWRCSRRSPFEPPEGCTLLERGLGAWRGTSACGGARAAARDGRRLTSLGLRGMQRFGLTHASIFQTIHLNSSSLYNLLAACHLYFTRGELRNTSHRAANFEPRGPCGIRQHCST